VERRTETAPDPAAPGAERRLPARAGEASGFPGRAEAHRRAGRPEEAERAARAGLAQQPDSLAGRVALALALLDVGRLREARRHLEQVVDASARSAPEPPAAEAEPVSPSPAGESPLADALAGAEFEQAFADVETEADAVIDADRIAIEAMQQVDREEALRPDPDSPFVTRTVATLLEQQGDATGAMVLRAAIEAREATQDSRSPDPADARRRRRAVLERWLSNLTRGRT
jgi:tetratricopeptide (TPR) repeat protein